MIRISLTSARPGMVLAKHIFSADGKVLLAAGVQLDKTYLIRLKELGVPSIYIYDRYTEDVGIVEIISDETRLEAMAAVNNLYQEAKESRFLNLASVVQSVENIVTEILQNRNALLNLTEVRAYDTYTFAHSVNVCVLSVLAGITLNYNRYRLYNLGIGALLHDIGKTRVNLEILQKQGRLSENEFETIKTHSQEGFNILRNFPELSLLSAHVAWQHHERLDGSGYPRGLQGKEIHPFAMIVAIADVLDAMTSERVYSRACHVHEAIDFITSQSGILFDPLIINSFMENIAPYPVSTLVQLNSGDIGVVVDVNRGIRHRPIVRVIFDREFQELPSYYEIDLSRHADQFIERVLAPDAYPYSHPVR